MSNNYQTLEFKNVKGHRIVLQEMIHIAPQSFYDHRKKQWEQYDKDNYTILIEGVQNTPEEFKQLNELYKKMALFLGFTLQPKPEKYTPGDIDYNTIPEDYKKTFHNLMKDLNIDKSKKDIEKFTKIYNNLSQSKKYSFTDKIFYWVFTKFINKNRKRIIESNPEKLIYKYSKFIKNYNDFMVRYRNEHAVNIAVDNDNNVVLPWGKAHIKGMIDLLIKNGYWLNDIVENYTIKV